MILLPMKIVYEGTAQLVMHPVRFKILKHINGSHKKQFVEEIAKAIDEHPRLVSHHLNVLEDTGLIECRYEVAKAKGSRRRRVAARFCTATPKLAEVFKDVAKAAEVIVEAK